MSGNYTINSTQSTGGTTFQSFTDFANEINTNGISSAVIVEVVIGSGPYNEQVVINSITGAGPFAEATLQGNGETIMATTNTTNRHVLRLANVQYFNINNLRIERDASSASGFYGIHIFNSGHNITITDCEVEMTGTNSTLVGGYILSGSEISILEPGDFSNIVIAANTARGGGYGASVYGQAFNLSTNILIEDNNFYDFHSNGVYLRETNGAIIRGNILEKTTASTVSSCNAIQIAQAANVNATINDNFFSVTQTNNGTMTMRGIYLFNGPGHKVYNNVIHDINLTSGNFSAIEIRTGGTSPEISFNTISIDNAISTSGELFGIAEELSNTNSILRNNIISITQPTSAIKSALI
ncbi:MAG: hypothetical protein H0U27_00245, partial [Nitrosopumilus sp.]|nr:hypothetical protein [Nitrosopumilus sp.]